MSTPITEENLRVSGWEQLDPEWPWMHKEIEHVYVDFINYHWTGTKRSDGPTVRVGNDAWVTESVPVDGCNTMEKLGVLLNMMKK